MGCSGGTTEPEEEGSPSDEYPIPSPGPHFSVPPVPLETVARITPMGYNNERFPTVHSYWQTCDGFGVLQSPRPCHREFQPVRAPRAGAVRDIHHDPDGYIVLEGPPGLIWTFGHVTPEPALQVGASVSAGDPVATMFYDHGFDFGVINYGVEHFWINPSRFNHGYLYGQNAIEQFPSPLADSMLARVMTVDGNPLGRLSYDVPGTASGAWFIEGAPPGDVALTWGNEHMLLWLARHVERQETRVLSLGELWPGMVNWLLAVDGGAPDWEDITPSSGAVTIPLWNLNQEARANLDWPAGSILIEMVDGGTLRIEWFDTHDPVEAFGAGVRTYQR
ncbi:MAG: hypothetical protein WD960_14920 [Gemmatimonadota bacterium]